MWRVTAGVQHRQLPHRLERSVQPRSNPYKSFPVSTGQHNCRPADKIVDVNQIPDHNKRERYLTQEEAQRLYVELVKSKNQMLKYIVPMLILTGARKREVLDAKWEDIDFLRNSWRIHTTKTGGARHIPLSEGAIALLKSIPRRSNCEWVFANPNSGKPYKNIFFSWDTARTNAGLKDVRIHDLRHSFASFVVNAGRSLYDVQHLLGHTQVKTTQRYAHLSQDTLLAAANAGTMALKGLFTASPSTTPALAA